MVFPFSKGNHAQGGQESQVWCGCFALLDFGSQPIHTPSTTLTSWQALSMDGENRPPLPLLCLISVGYYLELCVTIPFNIVYHLLPKQQWCTKCDV